MTDLAGGIALIVAAVFIVIRQLLLAPKNRGWPPAPRYVRGVMFMLAVACLFQGISLTGLAFTPEPGRVSPGGAAMCWTIMVYAVVTCLNVARQYYPPVVWRRIERILTLAECKNGGILIELSRRGIYVFMPNRPGDPEPIQPADIVDLPQKAG